MIDAGVLLASAAAVLSFQVVIWLVSLAMRDASIVDIVWGPAFLAIAAVSYWIGDGAPARSSVSASRASAIYSSRFKADPANVPAFFPRAPRRRRA